MNEDQINNIPKNFKLALAKCEEIGFTMPSDIYIGTLLKTLISSKPESNFLELGTGVGLSLAWMVDGMDESSRIISIDNDSKLTSTVSGWFIDDHRVNIICEDGAKWIQAYSGEKFDVIFADAWPGKYSDLEQALDLVNVGGMYIIDDMKPQPNWPEGHTEKAEKLLTKLESQPNFHLTKMNWSTGVVLMTKFK